MDHMKRLQFLVQKAHTAFRTKNPQFRIQAELAQIGIALWGELPRVRWVTDLHDQTHPAGRKFRQVMGEAFTPKGMVEAQTNLGVQAGIAFQNLKAIESADTPIWFSVSEGLTYQFLTTEIRGVYPDDIKLPFKGFNIEVPASVLWWRNAHTGMHMVRRLGVAVGHQSRLQEIKLQGKRTAVLQPQEGRCLLVLVYCEPNEGSTGPNDDHVTWFSFPLVEGTGDTCEAQLEAQDAFVLATDPASPWYVDTPAARFGGIDLTARQGREVVIRYLLNLLLYLNTSDPDVAHKHAKKIAKLVGKKRKRKTEKAQLRRLRDEKEWRVGSRVTVNPRIKKAVNEGKYVGRQLRFKSLVRGHWRNQVHGPGRALRKLIWIEPHIRGGNLEGDVLGHQYDVQ